MQLAAAPRKLECPELNCSSKATFKNRGKLEEHIRNIHRNPLLCKLPGCRYTEPFGRQTDLDRHVATKHGDGKRRYVCPFEDCKASTREFLRNDKLQAHVKDYHPMVRCGLNHCDDEIADTETVRGGHFVQAHGRYECALGSCESAPHSYFTEAMIRRHLRIHHRKSMDSRYIPLGIESEYIVSLGDFRYGRSLLDCPICAPQSPANGDA
ncbi:hypothetical protein QBC46DRAFT_99563 [Diplogelasinospora grovesii]|uniref:C2H2-type domain-containing protein n=1 Tax=Diplogelasinospora grovesii TaxID=303347 RepID=A0AAN6MVK8_9PEZI|nr:hypothetical protein QBC46DRAFT_99563 [Diplogelasinospora grovesii]